MSETKESKKIHVDDLFIEANMWWDNLLPDQKESIICETYMKRNGIGNCDVEW